MGNLFVSEKVTKKCGWEKKKKKKRKKSLNENGFVNATIISTSSNKLGEKEDSNFMFYVFLAFLCDVTGDMWIFFCWNCSFVWGAFFRVYFENHK